MQSYEKLLNYLKQVNLIIVKYIIVSINYSSKGKGDIVIKGIGIDIIELDRIKQSIQKNERIVDRILTKKERQRYEALTNKRRQVEFLAGRFAAKEAFAKANGTGIGKLSFQHIEIIPNEQGAPQIFAKGYLAEKLFVSISHSDTYAIAQVIITH